MNHQMIPVKHLKPLEYVNPHHLKNLAKIISHDKVMKTPLVVEDKYNIVLDGSNRYVFLMQRGFKYAPVLKVDYDNAHVRVGSHRVHCLLTENHPVLLSKEDIIRTALSGVLYPPRTTRHIFPFLRPEVNIPLDQLEKTEPANMDSFIANIGIEDEIESNKKYIREIEEETDELIRYLNEGRQTKKYLEWQIKEMENI